jgi:invasion protein IalB
MGDDHCLATCRLSFRLLCAAMYFRHIEGIGLRHLCLFVFVLTLAGSPGAGNIAMAKLQPEIDQGSKRTIMPLSASPRMTAESPTATLPNGASSINETYGSWTVDCRLIGGQKQCLLLHAQRDSQTGKQLFAIALGVPRDGKIEGTILMPFGLRLAAGAVMTLDYTAFGEGLPFSTCVPQGCLLPFSFSANDFDAMKEAKMLTVSSLSLGSSNVVAFEISLEGFAAAIARIGELGQ